MRRFGDRSSSRPSFAEPLELAIEGGEPLLGDLTGVRSPDLELVARPKLLRRNLLRPPAHAAGDVASIEPQLVAVAVDAADDDVRMRMARVVVVDGRPLDLAPQVPLDLGHEPPHVGREVQLARILGRHDEPKLVLLAKARLFERPPPHRSLGPVERALRAVLLDAVALDVPKVHRRGLRAVRGQPHDARLDDDATRIGPMRLGAQRARGRSPPHAAVERDAGKHCVAKRPRTGLELPAASASRCGAEISANRRRDPK